MIHNKMKFFRLFTSKISMEQFMYYKTFLIQQFKESVNAVNPTKLVADNVKLGGRKLHVCDKVYDIENGNVHIVGFGKAVLGMASQCEIILKNRLKSGVICVPENIRGILKNNTEFGLGPNSLIEVYEGAKNNLPDEKAEKGADRIINLVRSLDKEKDILMVLISGGGSALFPKPKPGVSLAEKLKTILLLASSGADIMELNSVRKKLSLVKGGGLACLSYPTKTVCLILSDVIGDPLEIIASGPTVPNIDSETAALDILTKYKIQEKVSKNVINTLKESCMYNVPFKGDKFCHVDNFLIGANMIALKAAKQYSEDFQFKTIILTSKINGLVTQIADFYLSLLSDILNCFHKKQNLVNETILKNHTFDNEENFINDMNDIINGSNEINQLCIITGGETTVKLQGKGQGGRCQELALTLSKKIYDLKKRLPHLFEVYDVVFLFAGTDGMDGPTDAAGALGEASVIDKALKMNLDPDEFLLNNDSYNFFQNVDDGSYLIKTGHTGTNVMDIHSILIYKKEGKR